MYHAIKSIYPDIEDHQFSLRDDGKGPYIERWDYDKPKPRKRTLEGHVEEGEKSRSIAASREDFKARLAEIDAAKVRAITDALLGEGTDRLRELEDEAERLRVALQYE